MIHLALWIASALFLLWFGIIAIIFIVNMLSKLLGLPDKVFGTPKYPKMY